MADEDNSTRQASAEREPGVHRLRDIVVEEVSLVDRAANKRRFLVVKRSGDMADDGKPKARRGADEDPAGEAARPGKKPRPRPGAEVDKARPRAMRAGSEDEEDETEKARRPASARGEGDEDAEDEVEADKAMSDEDEDEEDATKANKTRPRAKGAGAGGDTGGSHPRRSKPAEKADDEVVLVPAVKIAVLRALAEAIERLLDVANRIKEAEETDDESEASVPDDLAEELEEIGELLEEAGEQLAYPAAKAAGKKPGEARPGTSKAGVAKAGARMAKDRLDRFQKALALLSEVLKELTEAKAPADPTAGAAESKLAKRDAAPGMRELAAGLGELTQLVKRQADELVRLRKTHATSNAIPVDGARRREAQEVSWPLDMNRPISRDSVAKTISFYDE